MLNFQQVGDDRIDGFIDLQTGGEGLYQVGHEGVRRILTPFDRKVELIVYKNKTLAYVKSALGHPAIYPFYRPEFEPPAEAVIMDLDGTSVHSERFWIWVIQSTTAKLLGNPKFTLDTEDEPHVSGHSVSEHLQYCINKYCPGQSLMQAREYYFEIVHYESKEIMEGRGKMDAFVPNPGLKEFLMTLKENNIKIGLVTSGLYEKAWPEIVSAFRTLKMPDPTGFYDVIITAGFPLRNGEPGTLGELEPKPHPWLYAETARVGLGITPERNHKVIGIEDSGAGVISIRLAGFAAIGIDGGNIKSSGTTSLLYAQCKNLTETLPVILGK